MSAFLGQFESFGFLDDPMPLVDVSVNELLSLADKFNRAIQQAQQNSAGMLQFLESKLKEAFGLSSDSDLIRLSLHTDHELALLRVDIHLDTGFSDSLAFQFNLCGDGILTGGADLQTSGDLSLDFDFGIDLNNPTDVYLFDSTQFFRQPGGQRERSDVSSGIGTTGCVR